MTYTERINDCLCKRHQQRFIAVWYSRLMGSNLSSRSMSENWLGRFSRSAVKFDQAVNCPMRRFPTVDHPFILVRVPRRAGRCLDV